MNDVQEKLLEMFKWFHSFCELNNLTYYMIGGTFLGAVRHNGFIPWDDDIDVGMPRKDFDCFISLTNKISKEGYISESYENSDTDFFYPFGKLYDTSTTLIEALENPLKRGIYIDIFPLDGFGNTLSEVKSYYKRINKFLIINRVMSFVPNEKRTLLKNICIQCFHLLDKTFLPEKKLLRVLHNTLSKKSFYDYKYVGNIVGAYGLKEIGPREYFGVPKLYKFENFNFYGPQQSDNYLSSIYGNWQKLPPVEKQKSHHNYSFCDLHKSYLD